MVVNVIENNGVRCEVYQNTNGMVTVSIGPDHGDGLETQYIEMEADDLCAFIKMCRGALKELNDR